MDAKQRKQFNKTVLGFLQDPEKVHLLQNILAVPLPVTTEEQSSKPTNTLLYYFIRTLGTASLGIGVAALMTEISFLVSAGCIYLGLGVLCIDPLIEPALRKFSPLLRVILSLIFFIPLLAFTRYVVFLPATLKITATDYNGEFTPGQSIAGIEWKPAYSELEILFSNHTEHDYKDLDLVVGVNEYIAAVGKSEFPGVTVFNTQVGPDTLHYSHKDKDGRVTYEQTNNLKLLSGGVRVLCDKLPKDTSFSVVLAVVSVPSAGQPSASNSLLALQGSGIQNRDDMYGPRTAATEFGVSGWYKSLGQRPHRVRQMYEVKQQ